MDISTGSWFEYLREEVLTEGLRDIGLPEVIIDFIEEGMPNAPEKSKMYAGKNWKEHKKMGKMLEEMHKAEQQRSEDVKKMNQEIGNKENTSSNQTSKFAEPGAKGPEKKRPMIEELD